MARRTLQLWGRANAYNVQKVLWMLRELNLEFEHHDIGSHPGDLETAAFLELNPHARIPVIRDGDEVVWESNSILRYLAAGYSAGELWPQDAFARSLAERWMDWELSKLQPDFIQLFWGYYRTPPAARNAAVIDAARQACAQHLGQLDHQLQQHPFLAGTAFSMADIPCAVFLYRYFEMGLALEQPEHVGAWYRRLSQRDAYRETIMRPFEELKGRLDF